jgi:hypothetical protein
MVYNLLIVELSRAWFIRIREKLDFSYLNLVLDPLLHRSVLINIHLLLNQNHLVLVFLGHQLSESLVQLLSSLDDLIVNVNISSSAVRLTEGSLSGLSTLLEPVNSRLLGGALIKSGLLQLFLLLLKINDLNRSHLKLRGCLQ